MANVKAKGLAKKVRGGFSVEPTPEYLEKQEREKRMKERKANSVKGKANLQGGVPNEELYELMLDMADRQSEMYDLLKRK
ncbi:hypothetical protein [Virgibacillus sediminis]|uniref:Uncharacterized protein n=1 Tax=Virgibacillus sediminis TaxID=202260 RepID=A0ABV7A677_9BACI